MHFIIAEVTWNILIYKLDVLYKFDINLVFLMRYTKLFYFDLIHVNNKYSSWDRDQTGVKLGIEHTIYEKLANVNRFESVIFGMSMCILQNKTKCTEGTEFWTSW